MDNRAAGLLIVVAALVFLWLYDTGRWGDISKVIHGTPPSTNVSAFQTLSGGNQPGGFGSAGQPGHVGDGAIAGTICAAWPPACPYAPLVGGVKDAINGTLGSIFGFRL